MVVLLCLLTLWLGLPIPGCSQLELARGGDALNDILATISNPDTDREALTRAIQQVRSADVPSTFWADIANGENYRRDHRRWAVFELFRRYVRTGMTLGELGQVLGGARWLSPDSIQVVTYLIGELPVQWTPDDTVFVVPIFPGVADGRYAQWALYLRVQGKVNTDTLVRALRGELLSEVQGAIRILEFALSPDDPTNVNW
jgi:hypothetical protein